MLWLTTFSGCALMLGALAVSGNDAMGQDLGVVARGFVAVCGLACGYGSILCAGTVVRPGELWANAEGVWEVFWFRPKRDLTPWNWVEEFYLRRGAVQIRYNLERVRQDGGPSKLLSFTGGVGRLQGGWARPGREIVMLLEAGRNRYAR